MKPTNLAKAIAFIDIEVDQISGKVKDIGGLKACGINLRAETETEADCDSALRTGTINGLKDFLGDVEFICGHNIVDHDLSYIGADLEACGINLDNCIDTLYLSALLFPLKPYHKLVKDYKLDNDDFNNPLSDSKICQTLFKDEIIDFQNLPETLKEIYSGLLKDQRGFAGFFNFLDFPSARYSDFPSAPQSEVQSVRQSELQPDTKPQPDTRPLTNIIREHFAGKICQNTDLEILIREAPVELAYALALLGTGDKYSILPPWVMVQYPGAAAIVSRLTEVHCHRDCAYCNESLDIFKGLKRFFDFDSFRLYGGEPLQEQAVRAAMEKDSFLVIFPTGGGKSLTFQLPALIKGEASRGLTVVISPLQALMKDQIDNLEKNGITAGATINGLLDPLERAEAIKRVEDGSASILYISPELLRSKTIESLLLKRNVVRFVVDEAHCFSAWGQDFRVDYLHIGEFIKNLQEKKGGSRPIPVSCFTATARPRVINDICRYFAEKLGLNLEIFRAGIARTNLVYKVRKCKDDEEKYRTIRNLLDGADCPTIIYSARTKRTEQLAKRLVKDGYSATFFHGQMDNLTEKAENQRDFIEGKVQIMVATSAFGMGVDKKDVGLVIHYNISDSLENYVQEAGRAGRDENISAECIALFMEEDIDKHFNMLLQTKIKREEIQEIWLAIKKLIGRYPRTSKSALEIARAAGWDESDSFMETKVKTAIQALEEAGFVKRGYNSPRVYATGILATSQIEAIKKMDESGLFLEEDERETARRIMTTLIGARSRMRGHKEVGEDRVDYISDRLGIPIGQVIRSVDLLKEAEILADSGDMHGYIAGNDSPKSAKKQLDLFSKMEIFVAETLTGEAKPFNVKELNERLGSKGYADASPSALNTLFNYLAVGKYIEVKRTNNVNVRVMNSLLSPAAWEEERLKRYYLSEFIIDHLYELAAESEPGNAKANKGSDVISVEFSVLGLRKAYEADFSNMIKYEVTTSDVEAALLYLQKIGAMNIDGGFLVLYNKFDLSRMEENSNKRYSKKDYLSLDLFYKNRVQQIHIVGEYADLMSKSSSDAKAFSEDYFQLSYEAFIKKYFTGKRKLEIERSLTPYTYKKLIEDLSPEQFRVVDDNNSRHILVAAGPGSGKTKVLVHKMASLLLLEDVRPAELLMLTFSRSTAMEFKKRLIDMVGPMAFSVTIKTFHSYCFDVVEEMGSVDKSGNVIKKAVAMIEKGEVVKSKITKSALLIDEAQDMSEEEFSLIKALLHKGNQEMRVIAVGDDDQAIYDFRGADYRYMGALLEDYGAHLYELSTNYRSLSNLVDFANKFVGKLSRRIKMEPLRAYSQEVGRLKLTYHSGRGLLSALIHDLSLENLSGTTCVMTRTNEEAMLAMGLLLSYGIPAKLIQSNEGFALSNLRELRFFLEFPGISDKPKISQEEWTAAEMALKEKFSGSDTLPACLEMLSRFKFTEGKELYASSLAEYINEARLEDFYSADAGGVNELPTDIVSVSTIHKAKGREFDNVFLALDGYSSARDEEIRQLYVAITRAKSKLVIRYNRALFSDCKVDNLEYSQDRSDYPDPDTLICQLSHKDINLDYCLRLAPRIEGLKSGDELGVSKEGCFSSEGRQVLRFSKKFKEEIEAMAEKGYKPIKGKVRFLVYWGPPDDAAFKPDASNTEPAPRPEGLILLPDIYFQRISP